MAFHLMFVHVVIGSVWVAGWPAFGRGLLTRLAMCSLCSLTICNSSGILFHSAA